MAAKVHSGEQLPSPAPPDPARDGAAPSAGTSQQTPGPGGDVESSQSSPVILKVNLAVSLPTYLSQANQSGPDHHSLRALSCITVFLLVIKSVGLRYRDSGASWMDHSLLESQSPVADE
ncbi:hypothetical protein HPB47_026024 [Ixodes persulcatus]|uniref:Uncharacterized protein n=1 Tax=Ixodes persulcatus TaxID=34615 RepID=A0AC60Q137_IXOPE|nr:hypothetical protein HPB47_026024 [Ixodes persulcatus]